MKNKKTVYLALPVVIGLWALVIYKVVQIYSAPAENTAPVNSFVPPALNSGAADTFSIAANYPDPFLAKTETHTVNKTEPPKKVKVTEPLKWPVITYGGMMKSLKSNEQLCVVSINGQSNFMKEGGTVANVQVKKIYRDSIEVVFQKEKRVVRK